MKYRIAFALLVPAVAMPAQGRIELPVSLSQLEESARRDSNDAVAHYNLALGFWNERRWDDVEESLRRSLELDPRLALSHMALSRLPYARHSRLGEDLLDPDKLTGEQREMIVESDREWRHALMIDPMVDLRLIAASYSAGLDQWLVRDVLGEMWGNYFQASIDCYEGRYEMCEQRFRRVLDDFQDIGSRSMVPDGVHFMMGLAAARTGNHDDAIRSFRILMEREDDRKNEMEERDLVRVPLRTNEFRYFIASISHAAGKNAEAVRLYREAAENDLGLYMAHVRLAAIHEAARNYPNAIAERKRAIDANPDDATLHLDLGIALGKSGDFAAAEKAIRVTTERIPRHVEAWFWLGLALEQQGKRSEARDAYQQVVELAPSRLKARSDAARQKVTALQ